MSDLHAVYVYSMNRLGSIGAWSRYVFPWRISDYAVLGNDLFVRHGDYVSRVVDGYHFDQVFEGGVVVERPFEGVWQTLWADVGQLGQEKMLESVDVIATGSYTLSVGYDQRDPEAFTEPYAVEGDTLPAGPVPIPVMGPSFALKLVFAGGEKWTVTSAIMYLHDNRMGL